MSVAQGVGAELCVMRAGGEVKALTWPMAGRLQGSGLRCTTICVTSRGAWLAGTSDGQASEMGEMGEWASAMKLAVPVGCQVT